MSSDFVALAHDLAGVDDAVEIRRITLCATLDGTKIGAAVLKNAYKQKARIAAALATAYADGMVEGALRAAREHKI